MRIINLLKQIISLLKSQALNSKEVLSIDELVLYTGLSKSHIYKLTAGRQIPYYKPKGKIVYFKREEIDSWLLRNKSLSQEELSQEVEDYLNLNNLV